MIGQRYSTKKTAVLDVVRRYQCNRGGDEDGVDPAFLSERATALEKGRYVLAVVGEAKAGKSTLINALLGERILPTDVLQSSSAVVEIFKSEEKFLEVHYADGGSEKIRDDLSTPDTDEAFDYLRKVGAIQDRFRDIPTALIDSFIIHGRIEPGAALPIPELEKHSGLPLKDREKLVAEYVKGRTLANIPVKIEFGFPLTYAFDDLRLVDSPGVNAVGGVESQIYDYLHKVNAVLFVHSLEESIETGSFRDFVMKVVPNRTKEALFLVLSKSGGCDEIEVEGKLLEARSLFRQEFDSDRVIAVDSMLQMVSDEIQAFKSALALKRHFGEKRRHYKDLYESEPRQEWRDQAVNYRTKWRLLNETLETTGADADRDTVAKELRTRSNFDNLETAIEKFSAQAPEVQLSELLQAVRKGYDNQLKAHRQTIELLGRKKEHPQTFETEIGFIQERLAEYERELNEFGECLHGKHTGVNALSRDEVQQIRDQFLQQLDEPQSDDHINKMVADFNDASAAIVDRIAGGIRTECQTKLASLGSAAKATYNITLPQVDVDSITAQAKQLAYKTVRVKVDDSTGPLAVAGLASGAAAGAGIGFIFGPLGALVGSGIGALAGAFTGSALGEESYEETKKFDPAQYRQEKCGLISAAVREVCDNTVPATVSKFIDNLVEIFKREVGKLIKARRASLQEMKTRKRTNEEIVAHLSSEERKKKRIDREMGRIAEMDEDLR